MAKKKSDDYHLSEIDQAQIEIRKLKQINRSLMKRLKKVDRHWEEHVETEEEIKEAEDKYQVPVKEEKCTSCNEGVLLTVNITGRTWKKCSSCKFRTTAVKVKDQ